MSLKEKLAGEIEHADWGMLADHHKRGALFVVDQTLDLIDVGVAIAEDDVSLVKIWLDNKQLNQLEDVKQYDDNPNQKVGRFIIVQPYVLLKLDQ